MNIIVVGIGKNGMALLQSLTAEGHDVIAIDNDPQIISQVSNQFDLMCVCGNGVDWETLSEARADKAELLIAVTGSDEFNMLCCFMAKKVGVKHTVARIRKPEYNDQSLGFMRQQLELSMVINPDALAAKELFNLLKLPGAANIETFSRRRFELVELILRENSLLDGISLQEMRKKYPAAYLVGMVHRDGETVIPGGTFRLKSGDRIGLTGTAKEIERLLSLLGLLQGKAKSVMIVGASRTAFYLTKMLIDSGSRVTVIEKDKAVCVQFAEAVPEAVVICGDGANEELLLEERLDSMDAFVSLTGSDEKNILLSCLANTRGVQQVITKINREEFYSIAGRLGLDCIVTPKQFMNDLLTRFARALDNSVGSSVETLYKLMGGAAEALEFVVREEFPAKDVPLKELQLKPNTLIAGILRGRKVIIPTGNDVICVGDSVVVLTAAGGLTDLKDILR